MLHVSRLYNYYHLQPTTYHHTDSHHVHRVLILLTAVNWSMRWQHWVDTTECQVTWGGPVPIDIEDGVADIILEQFNLT